LSDSLPNKRKVARARRTTKSDDLLKAVKAVTRKSRKVEISEYCKGPVKTKVQEGQSSWSESEIVLLFQERTTRTCIVCDGSLRRTMPRMTSGWKTTYDSAHK
jgi:hypothetical protein